MAIAVSAHGATVLSAEPPAEEGAEFNSDPGELHTSFVPWSCKQPGTVYSYVVTATPGFGEQPQLTKAGSFAGASKRQCEEAPRLARRKHHEEVREQRAEKRRKLEEELARDRLYEANCRKVGGKPVTIQTDEGPELVCRSQTGGIVEA